MKAAARKTAPSPEALHWLPEPRDNRKAPVHGEVTHRADNGRFSATIEYDTEYGWIYWTCDAYCWRVFYGGKQIAIGRTMTAGEAMLRAAGFLNELPKYPPAARRALMSGMVELEPT